MARLGLIFQSVSIVVVVLAALACASGDTKNKSDASTAGTNAMTGGGGGQSGSSTPPTGSGGSTTVPPEQTATGGTPVEPGPVCGNNITEEGEMCDGDDIAGASCESLMPGYTGDIVCMADCQNYDTTMCFQDSEQPVDGVDASTGEEGGYGG